MVSPERRGERGASSRAAAGGVRGSRRRHVGWRSEAEGRAVRPRRALRGPWRIPVAGGGGAGRGGEGIAEAGGRSGRKLGSAWEGDPSGSRWPGHGDGMM